MKIRQQLFIAFFVFAFSLAAYGQAQPPKTQVSLYGIHFLNYGQSMRVAVQNPKFSDSEIIPCVRVRVVFDVYENSPENGRLLLLRRVSREVELDAGEAVSFDLPALRTGNYVSAAIFATPEGEVTGDGSVRIASTLNIREAGRTILNLPAVEKGFDPQPDPPNEP
jgi:hypothetical protein